ncbi:hypothetical protein AZI86_01720 [Bdellovibrio bacteriovorus]|uniref:Flagellar motor switch protein FliG C-terminal domain-containing protein n=1 Tax=Bdellovibrio bacteriovorus TaxID=959 RepID=A0A150WND0_BDEBC|nr:hypothetical protein [Bdellovibrio bacteriovorus]KYG65817.1 hypothetical protein AZI86_01720 [Bdellovibrio bacteriovorus]
MKKTLGRLFVFLCVTTAALADVRTFERNIEENIQNLAQVQFGTRDSVAVVVKATSSKKAKAAPDEPGNAGQDIGYLPLPYWNESKIDEDYDNLAVSIVASANIESKALNVFKENIRKMYPSYKVVVQLRSVELTEPKKRDVASEAAKKESPPSSPSSEDGKILPKDFLNVASFFLGLVILGALLFLGMRFVAGAIKSGAEALSGLLTLKQAGDKPPSAETANEEPDAPSAAVDQVPDLFAGSLDSSLEQLRHMCAENPYKVFLALAFTPADQIGLRWLLSQLDESSRALMKNFLGPERVSALSKDIETPPGFSLRLWAQGLVEDVSLRMLSGPSFLEKSLKNDDIVFLFNVDKRILFESAQKAAHASLWRLVLEVLSTEAFEQYKSGLTQNDWMIILSARNVGSEEVSQSIGLLKDLIGDVKNIRIDDGNNIGAKIIDPLIESIKELGIGDDEEFIDKLRQKQPDIAAVVAAKVWTFGDLRTVDEKKLGPYLASLSNESLYSLLFVASEEDRNNFQAILPPGMKKEVVLDLLRKGLEKNDADERVQALKLARQSLDGALVQLKGKKKDSTSSMAAA